ncbi:hypothetical protein BGZ61DRAFT_474909 [Ilyonectria robusta]|uniref:uncharacterized protein n=1 Tax=Ilyonectria robusta TaxID=1079257 RepID=UPI001E8EB3EB|nr:uncharacterized protein BGZ61DRAFT_474909 [Ilyonectria robusta]KAH8729265.1 hypothetical protein BGZ61DRAFT_474909 [Ilyonectria robusta]
MLFVYLLGWAKAFGLALATSTISSEHSVTESSHAVFPRDTSDMIYGETPTCSEECMATRDAAEALNRKAESATTSQTHPEPSHILEAMGILDVQGGVDDLEALSSRADITSSPHSNVPTDPVGPNVRMGDKVAFSLDFTGSMPTQDLFDTSSQLPSIDLGGLPPFELDTTVTISHTGHPWRSNMPGFNPGTPLTTAQFSSEPPSSSTSPPSASTSANPPSGTPLSKAETIGVVVAVLGLLLVAMTLRLLYCRFVFPRRNQASPQPPDLQLVGFPYPTPLLSPGYSPVRSWRDSQRLQTTTPRHGTTSTENISSDERDHAASAGAQNDLTRSEVGQPRTCAPEEYRVSPLGSSAGRKSRSTIESILSAYTPSRYSELNTENNETGATKRVAS